MGQSSSTANRRGSSRTVLAKPGQRVRRADSRRRKGSVLVMDDDSYITEILCEMLHDSGYEVHSAESGEEAIRCFLQARERGHPIGTVILDLNIPSGMGGDEALGRLRDMDPDVRAILLTGDINHPEILRFRESGFSAALLKPFTRAELLHLLNGAPE